MNPRKSKVPAAASPAPSAAVGGGPAAPCDENTPSGWRLPSGESLAQYGLDSGLIAMELLGGRAPVPRRPEEARRARRGTD